MKRDLRLAKASAPSRQYYGARPNFRSGDIFAQSHGSWANWHDFKVMCVRAFTLSTYSHVGVIEVAEDGRVYAIEAVRPKVHRVLLSSIGDFDHLPMQANWTKETDAYVKSILGTPYSELDAIRAYFEPLPAGTVTECAALVREVLWRADVGLGPMSRPDKVVQTCLELGSSLTFVHQ